MESTKVIFRMWYVDGKYELIALFPEIPSDVTSWYNCLSYQHVGQHGGCDPFMIMNNSRPAKMIEYYDLMQELESIGYILDIKQRMTQHMNDIRYNAWEN